MKPRWVPRGRTRSDAPAHPLAGLRQAQGLKLRDWYRRNDLRKWLRAAGRLVASDLVPELTTHEVERQLEQLRRDPTTRHLRPPAARRRGRS